jgi:hypothetical protein
MVETTRPVSSPQTSRGGRIAAFLFCAVFVVVGVALAIPVLVRPLTKVVAAQHWTGATCEIVSSSLRTHSSSDGTTYSVDVTYRYVVGTRVYTSNRYQFVSASTSGGARQAAIVARLRPGSRTPCWVDPANPADAVIERGLTIESILMLLPLLFVAGGAAGMYVVASGRGPFGRTTTASAPYTQAARVSESTALRPKIGRGVTLAGLIVVALFWNGIVSVFLFDLLFTSKARVFNVFLALFLTPFVLIGIVLIVVAVTQALRLSNPRPTVTVSTPAVALGDQLGIDWTLDGRVAKLTRLTITLEGREEATYRRGTDTQTDTHLFAAIPIASQQGPDIAAIGSARVTIPAGTMHSFQSAHNKIVWAIRVRGEVPKWPDSDDEFPIAVSPGAR